MFLFSFLFFFFCLSLLVCSFFLPFLPPCCSFYFILFFFFLFSSRFFFSCSARPCIVSHSLSGRFFLFSSRFFFSCPARPCIVSHSLSGRFYDRLFRLYTMPWWHAWPKDPNMNMFDSRMIQLYTYTCGSKIKNNDERTHFYRKIYLSHFIRNGCERVGDWTNCKLLTPSSFVFSSTSFSFCWPAQSGVLGAHSPLLGAGSLYSILSPTNWLQLIKPVCDTGLYICLSSVHLPLVGVTSAPNSTRP